jgi:DNA-binding LacI/PurR family transcriptional regulator
MARPKSAHTLAAKEKLLQRLRDGFHPPGQRFLSNRAIASRYGVSYQTAHRLSVELEAEGWIERRQASGTYVAGPSQALRGVELFFHPRSKRPGSFGAQMLSKLQSALGSAGLEFTMGNPDKPRADLLPVVWERPEQCEQLAANKRFVVLIYDQPNPGLEANYVDSVSTDDFSGGVVAGQLLRAVARPRQLAMLAGPRSDRRARQRVAGFQVHCPKSRVFWSPTWFADDASDVVKRVMAASPQGVFCANDRLAEALLAEYQRVGKITPALVGYDDAPIAEALELSTIAVPWADLVAAVVETIQRRLSGYTGATSQRIFSPRPVHRLTLPK